MFCLYSGESTLYTTKPAAWVALDTTIERCLKVYISTVWSLSSPSRLFLCAPPTVLFGAGRTLVSVMDTVSTISWGTHSALTRPTSRRPRVELLTLLAFLTAIAAQLCVVHGGKWDGKCPTADRTRLITAAKACPVGPISRTSAEMLRSSDLRAAAGLCAAGCSCEHHTDSLTFQEQMACSATGCCTNLAEVSLISGAMFIMPGILCRMSASLVGDCDCAASTCRYRCDSIASKSCLAQMQDGDSDSETSSSSASDASKDKTPSSTSEDASSSSSDDSGASTTTGDGSSSSSDGSGNSTSKSTDNEGSRGLSTMEIVGISIGAVVGILAVVIGAFQLIVQLKDRERKRDNADPPAAPGPDNGYGAPPGGNYAPAQGQGVQHSFHDTHTPM